MKNKYLACLIAGLFALGSCEEALLSPEYENTAVDNFECIWKNYDLYYGQFLVRNINWDSLYAGYRPKISHTSSDEELAKVIHDLIWHFHDDHVFIDPTVKGLKRIESGRSDTMKIQTDFLAETVENNYLAMSKQYSGHIWYGKINEKIGYVRMDVFADPVDFAEKAFDDILEFLSETSGIIFDIRKLEGGDDRLARYIAGRFASERSLYMTSRKRNGPRHDDFESEIRWYVNPEGSFQYTKPVMLLTGRFTASAGETFTLAMNRNRRVTQIGDTTLGAFSDVMSMELPNGWLQAIPVGDYRNHEGISLEGIGVAPEIFARSTKNETLAGKDKAMDAAIKILTE